MLIHVIFRKFLLHVLRIVEISRSGLLNFAFTRSGSIHASNPLKGISKDSLTKAAAATLGTNMDINSNGDNDNTSKSNKTKEYLVVRHGVSVWNERMNLPGNEWGSPTFRDDPSLIDTPLSKTGEELTKRELPYHLLHDEDLRSYIVGTNMPNDTEVDEDGSSDGYNGVELVLISPLRRCLQTYMYGVEPVLLELLNGDEAGKGLGNDGDNVSGKGSGLPIPVLALPLLRERVFTASDTGRPVSILEKEFPSIDFSECRNGTDDEQDDGAWWYTGPSAEDAHREEWRPHGQGQWYAVPGEPDDVFDSRMDELKLWLSRRKETKIILVTHWGVLHYLTNGTDFKNAEAKIIRI